MLKKKIISYLLIFTIVFPIFFFGCGGMEKVHASTKTGELDLGGYVKFGQYNGYNLEWIVIHENSERTILMSTKAVERVPFHSTDDRHYTWEGSYAKQWLNSTFLNSAFVSEEINVMVDEYRTLIPDNTSVKDEDLEIRRLDDSLNVDWWNNNTEITNAYVALPSSYEVSCFYNILLTKGKSYDRIDDTLLDGSEASSSNAWTRDYYYRTRSGRGTFSMISWNGRTSYGSYGLGDSFTEIGTVRPVIYLKPGTPMSGDGSKYNPYELITNTPPKLNSISIPANNTEFVTGSIASVNGKFTDTDKGQAIDIQYRINKRSWKDLKTVKATGNSQNFVGTIPLVGLQEGSHSLRFRARDADTEVSNVITRNIQIVSILKEVNDKIVNYIPSGKTQDTKIVTVNTNNVINNNTTNTNLINSIKENLNNRDVDGLYFIGEGGSYIDSKLTNSFKDTKNNHTTSIDVNSIKDYVVDISKNVSKAPSDKLAVSDSVRAYVNDYKMQFYDDEKDYFNLSLADKLKTTELSKDKRKTNPYGYYYNGSHYPLRVKYEHNHKYYDTPAPKQHEKGQGEWFYVKDLSKDPNLIKEFTKDMRGEWKLYVQAYDYTKRTNGDKDKYDRESDVNDYYTFLVHNYPEARIHKTSESGATTNLSGEQSFDIDFIYSKPNNGIASYKWKGQPRNGSGTWTTLGTGKTISVNKSTYKTVELTVADVDGATDTTIMDVDYIPPIVPEPKPDFVADEEIFTGRYGSDELKVTDITEDKQLVKDSTYQFGFRSASGYLSASNSTSKDENPTFAENTLKYNGNSSVLSKNPKEIRLSVNSNTSSNILSPIGHVKFTPVSITNIAIEPDDYIVSEDEFDVIVTTKNGQTGPHELFVTIEGDSTKYKAEYGGNNKWRVTLKAPTTPATTTIDEVKIDALIQQTGNKNVVYDRTDLSNRGKIVKVLNAELDFSYITKKYNNLPYEYELNGTKNPYYAYAGEKIFIKDTIKETGIANLKRRSIWLDRGNKLGQGNEFKLGYLQQGSHTFGQKIEIVNSSTGKVYELPKNLNKNIEVYQLQVKGEQNDNWSFGSTQKVKATVTPTINIMKYSDITVWAEINYKLEDGTFYKDKIKLDREGNTNVFSKNIEVKQNITVDKKISEDEHDVEYVIRSTRSGENDTNKTMHPLAIDSTNKITTSMPRIVANDLVEYATYQKEVEIEVTGLQDDWNVFTQINGLFSELQISETGENKYKYKINPSSTVPVQKDSNGINITRVEKPIVYKVKDSGNTAINFVKYLKEGTVMNTSDYTLTILTPRFKRDSSNNLMAINTPEEVDPTESFFLEVSTEEMNSAKFDVVAKSALFDSDVYLTKTDYGNENKYDFLIESLEDKAGYYDIAYQIISKNNGEVVDEVVKPIYIKSDLFNPRIIDVETNRPNETIIPNREYEYKVDSTINVGDVKVSFVEGAIPLEMKKVNVNAEDGVVTWSRTITKAQTKEISKVKGNIQEVPNDRSFEPNVLIVGEIAHYSGVTKDSNETPRLDYNIEVKVNIEGTIDKLKKIIHGELPVELDTIPASETLKIEGIQLTTNVELDNAEVQIPIDRYKLGQTVLTDSLTNVNLINEFTVGTEKFYVYSLGDSTIEIPKETLDKDYKVYINAETINGSSNQIEVAAFRVKTPVDLEVDMASTLVVDTTTTIKATTSKYVNSVVVDVFSDGKYVLALKKDGAVYKEGGEYKQNWKIDFNVPTGITEGEYIAKFTARTPNGNKEIKTHKFELMHVKLENFRAITIYDIRWKDLFVSSNRRTNYQIVESDMPIRKHNEHPIRLGYKLEFEIDSIGLDPLNADPNDNVYIDVTVRDSNGIDITNLIPGEYRTIGKSNSKFKTHFTGNSQGGTWKFEYYLPSNLQNMSKDYLDIEFEIIAFKQGREAYNYNLMNGFDGKVFRYDTTKTAEDDYYIQGGN